MLVAGFDFFFFRTKQALRKYYLEQEKQQTALNKSAEVLLYCSLRNYPQICPQNTKITPTNQCRSNAKTNSANEWWKGNTFS